MLSGRVGMQGRRCATTMQTRRGRRREHIHAERIRVVDVREHRLEVEVHVEIVRLLHLDFVGRSAKKLTTSLTRLTLPNALCLRLLDFLSPQCRKILHPVVFLWARPCVHLLSLNFIALALRSRPPRSRRQSIDLSVTDQVSSKCVPRVLSSDIRALTCVYSFKPCEHTTCYQGSTCKRSSYTITTTIVSLTF